MKERLYLMLAVGFGLGHLPGPTGSYGAALGLALLCLASLAAPPWAIAMTAVPLFFVCVWAAELAARRMGLKDPRQVVCDEIFGQWFTLLFFPLHWKTALAGFLAFRFFDIAKPFPARRLEHLPGGWGIVMDDLMAAVYAHLLLQVLFHYHVLR